MHHIYKILLSTFATYFITSSAMALETCPSHHQACFKGPTNSKYEEAARLLKNKIQFDYDTDGCLPSSGIHKDQNGVWIRNKGISAANLRPTKDCVFQGQIDPQQKIASTIYRTECAKGTDYCASMFAIYMVKDVGTGGHANDWEHGILWTTKDAITHVSYSTHGKAKTDIFNNTKSFYKDANTALLVYHKDGTLTHALRFSKKNEIPENPLKSWITPYPIDWHLLAIDEKNAFEKGDYGSASFPIKDDTFYNNLKKAKPANYPDITK